MASSGSIIAKEWHRLFNIELSFCYELGQELAKSTGVIHVRGSIGIKTVSTKERVAKTTEVHGETSLNVM